MKKIRSLVIIVVFLIISSSANQVNNGLKIDDESPNTDPMSQCQYQCQDNVTCLQECINVYGQSKQTAKLIGISAGVICFLTITVVVLVACFFPCLCCPCHSYQRFKRNYNQIYDGNIKDQDYQKNKNGIIDFLNVTELKGTFCITVDEKLIPCRCQAKVIKQEKFKTKIMAWGCDDGLGEWIAHGYILMKKQGISLWLYKIYKGKQKIDLIGKCNNDLVLISTCIYQGKEMQGKWYYSNEKQQDEEKLRKGSWHIKMRQSYSVQPAESVIFSNSSQAVHY